MKHLLTKAALALVVALTSSSLFAGGHDRGFKDYAQVTDVEPIYSIVRVSTPQRECWDRPRRTTSYRGNDSYTEMIAGGLIGGVVGNQFGKGNGKTAMTVAGTLLGGSIGRDLGNRPSSTTSYDSGRECQMTERYHEEERLDGYQVTYKYKGNTYVTEMDEHPGKRIPVEVTVRPAYYY